MIKFGHIEYLLLLFLIPIILMLIFWYKKWQKKNRLKFYSRNLEKSIIKNKSFNQRKNKIHFSSSWYFIFNYWTKTQKLEQN